MQIVVSSSMSATTFKYGLRESKTGKTQPADYVDFIPLARARFLFPNDEQDFLGGVVVYENPLSYRDVAKYRLTDLNTSSEEAIWNDFVTFVRTIRSTSPDYSASQFSKDYLNADSPRAKENPLFRYVVPNSNIIYGYLRKFTKYSPTYKGFQGLWETLK